MGQPEEQSGRGGGGPSQIPKGSVFYSRVVPALLIGLGILTVLLIIVAVGILLRIVPYR